MISRGFPNILSNDLATAKQWYVDLLGWESEFDSDWFVHLKSPTAPNVELGILDAKHEIVPSSVSSVSGGTLLTFVVDDVEVVYQRASELGHAVLEPPTDLFYGQRRMILADPDGTHIDISSDCPPSKRVPRQPRSPFRALTQDDSPL